MTEQDWIEQLGQDRKQQDRIGRIGQNNQDSIECKNCIEQEGIEQHSKEAQRTGLDRLGQVSNKYAIQATKEQKKNKNI